MSNIYNRKWSANFDEKSDYLYRFVEAIVKSLSAYETELREIKFVDWRIKEGIMHALSCLKDHLMKNEELKMIIT